MVRFSSCAGLSVAEVTVCVALRRFGYAQSGNAKRRGSRYPYDLSWYALTLPTSRAGVSLPPRSRPAAKASPLIVYDVSVYKNVPLVTAFEVVVVVKA